MHRELSMKLISDEFEVLSSNIYHPMVERDGEQKRPFPEIKSVKLKCKDCGSIWTSHKGDDPGQFQGTKSIELQCNKCDNYGVVSFKNA